MRVSRRRFIGGGTLLASALAVRQAMAMAAEADPAVIAAIDEAARSAIDVGACAGIAMQVSLRGHVYLSRNYGQANLECDDAVSDNTIFRIGSLTKQFTAALIVKLASDGRLGLTDPVSKHLRFFSKHASFTILELLNHTAGLHDTMQEISCPAGSDGPKSQIELAREISGQDKVFDFDPGTAWLYSNANYIVLGAVVEAITDKPLADSASAMIFEPLGLASTAFDTSAAIVRGRADGYSPAKDGGKPLSHAPFIEISDAGGAGAMRSTAGDLCQWHHLLFANHLFDRKFVAMLTTPGRLRNGDLSGSNRFSPDDASYGDVQYGMGFLVPPPSQGHTSALHYGFISGFSACLETFTDIGLTTAILCNGDIGPHTPFQAIRRIVSSRILPEVSARA